MNTDETQTENTNEQTENTIEVTRRYLGGRHRAVATLTFDAGWVVEVWGPDLAYKRRSGVEDAWQTIQDLLSDSIRDFEKKA